MSKDEDGVETHGKKLKGQGENKKKKKSRTSLGGSMQFEKKKLPAFCVFFHGRRVKKDPDMYWGSAEKMGEL